MNLNVFSPEMTIQNIALVNVIIKPSQKKALLKKYANIVMLNILHPHLKLKKDVIVLNSV